MFEKKGRDLLQVRYFLCEKRQRDRSDRKEGYDVSVAGSTAGSTDHPEWGILRRDGHPCTEYRKLFIVCFE